MRLCICLWQHLQIGAQCQAVAQHAGKAAIRNSSMGMQQCVLMGLQHQITLGADGSGAARACLQVSKRACCIWRTVLCAQRTTRKAPSGWQRSAPGAHARCADSSWTCWPLWSSLLGALPAALCSRAPKSHFVVPLPCCLHSWLPPRTLPACILGRPSIYQLAQPLDLQCARSCAFAAGLLAAMPAAKALGHMQQSMVT